VVSGAPGIGKSRLATELAAAIAGEATVLSGRCLSYGDAITYWPLRELVAQAAGGESPAELEALLAGEDDAALVAERLASAIGAADTATSAEDILWAARRLVETLARRRPLVLVVDDVHWAEEGLLDLIQHVVDRASDAPALVVALTRPELFEARPAWAEEALELEPLAEAEADELLAALAAGAALAPETLERVREAAEGNPLFLEQLVAHVLELGGLVEETPLPPTIQALLTARLERLGPGERAVLDAAAVIGRDFWDGAVRVLLPAEARPSVLRHLDTLAGKQLLRPQRSALAGEEAFSFGHVLIQAVAYRTVPKARRAELHEGFADWLDAKEDAFESELDEIVGYHLEQAFRYGDELTARASRAHAVLGRRAASHLGDAGLASYSRQDLRAAENLLRRSIACLPSPDVNRTELAAQLGEVLVEAGHFDEARVALEDALADALLAEDRLGTAHATLARLGLDAHVDPDGWAARLDREQAPLARVLEAHRDDRAIARLHRLVGMRHWLLGQAAKALEAWEVAAQHARRAGDSRERLECLRWLVSAACFGPMPVEDAIPYCWQILGVLGSSPACEPPVLGPLAMLEAMREEFGEARTLLARADRSLREAGNEASLTSGSWWTAGVELLAAHANQAEAILRTELERLETIGERSWAPWIGLLLATALCEQDRYEEARPIWEHVRRESAESDLIAQYGWRGIGARILARQGETESAERLGFEAVRLADRGDFLVDRAEMRWCLAEALTAAGRTADADRLRREAFGLWERKGDLATCRRLGMPAAVE
jgi:tetratricopeptide (TPR) repeat protein